jgi:hypothetical protein
VPHYLSSDGRLRFACRYRERFRAVCNVAADYHLPRLRISSGTADQSIERMRRISAIHNSDNRPLNNAHDMCAIVSQNPKIGAQRDVDMVGFNWIPDVRTFGPSAGSR